MRGLGRWRWALGMPLLMATVVVALVMGRDTVLGDVSFTVNTTADTVDVSPGDGSCADSGGACSLRAAVMEANAQGGGTIRLPAGTYVLTLGTGG